jgi:hypothetical protein
MHWLYVYYRVDPDDAGTLEAQLSQLFARLACSQGVTGQLMKKQDEPVWLEIYGPIADCERFRHALHAQAARCDLDMWIIGTRHEEWFTASPRTHRKSVVHQSRILEDLHNNDRHHLQGEPK